ncbi:alpha/beta hydrolase [Pseudoflavitalea sp. G-6-1-2]|uniref:alpha/beta fold hydrolase n=1 Tax=Pseudoflavitalea sp. G-6-1-2 TaxID=2728841 RepID=UPI00146CB570|nr:alpha/beta hydrolase [Pseudoflavitalea sp. G-6-1-2]NML23217.1 alpha/beta hydrolase [Pseudoflavitalea sp. G-6-1-2]
MKISRVYFISGLAADERVFRHIKLPEGVEMVHLNWITPNKNETLAAYAMRLAEKIDTSKPFAIAGLSFGGMLATEIAKRYQPVQTILISSIPLSDHLPKYFRAAGAIGLHRIIPIGFVKMMARSKRFFTTEKGEDKKLLWEIINDSDNNFIRWAMNAILSWKNTQLPEPLMHIHGTRDEVLPGRFTKPTHVIPKAGHLLVLTAPQKVNKLLAEVVSS